MSARFAANYAVLLLGACLLVFLYAFDRTVGSWSAVAVGTASIVLAMYSFASADQGVYQRLADVAIAALGAWAIVAARVIDSPSHWLLFGAGVGLAGLGAIGLFVREIHLSGGLQVGGHRIGPDQFARMSALQRDAEARR